MQIHVRLGLLLVALFWAKLCQAQLIVAHRGASHDAPENTLPAFELAWEQGADAIEADFYLTSDGKIICFHDKDTERIAGVKHAVKETPLAVLRELEVGSWFGEHWKGERMPLFSEVLDLVPPGKMIFLDLKAGPEIVQPLLDGLDASSLEPEQVVIICFDEATIAECKRLRPELKAHWLSGYREQPDGTLRPTVEQVIEVLRECKADGFGSKAVPEHFNREFLNRLAEAGFDEFHVWTVDNPRVALFYQQLGAWGVTTNRPGFIRERIEPATVEQALPATSE